MCEMVVGVRNAFLRFCYKTLLKPFLFRKDPETVHDRFTSFGRLLGSNALTRALTRLAFGYSHPLLRQRVLGIEFPNPLGLSAGFDKDALLIDIIPRVGFGFEEAGSVTGEPCAGNPKPRLWRVPEWKSLRVWYGLKNDGCERIARRIAGKKHAVPLGVSVAKTNCAETADTAAGINDYAKAFRVMKSHADYLTVNISCPNAFGGQPFTTPARLDRLLKSLDAIPTAKPVFLKLSPDMPLHELDRLLHVAAKHRVHGLICANLTKKGSDKGGLSGGAVQDMSLQMLRHIRRRMKDRFVLVAVGGIFTAEDAYERIRSGASLLQLITAMVYEGPQVVSDINRGLVRLLQRDGYENIKDAIGSMR